MGSWARNQLGLADESTYGTAATSGVKGYGVTSESFSPETVELTHQGFRRQRQGVKASEYAQIFVGGTGELTVPIPVDKNDVLFKDCLGAHTAFGSNSWGEASNETGPTTGKTLVVKRGIDGTDSTVEQIIYTGGITTGWSVSVSAGGFAEFTRSFWWQKQAVGGSSLAVGGVPNVRPFRWTDTSVTWDGTAIAGVTGFSLDADLGMDTGRAFLDGVTARSQPRRNTIPSYTGSIEMLYNASAQSLYTAWRNGSIKTITLKLSASDYVSSGTNPSSITFTVKAARFTGEGPAAAADGYSTITLPFMALEPDSGNTVAIAGVAKAAA